MPELPEVETVRAGLAPVLVEQRIQKAEIRRPDLRWPVPENMAVRLTGARVERLARRSKFLLAALDTGETLISHLGMSGRWLVMGAAPLAAFRHDTDRIEKHDHVILELEKGAQLVFNDVRRFGAMDLWPSDDLEAHRWLEALGPEPLGNGFSADTLLAGCSGRRTPIKAVLLDQHTVAGLGNIYVCEALWAAGISPLACAGRLDADGAARLVAAIREVLRAAIAAGGSSLRDFRGADGELGYFQHDFAVYGRAGEACRRPGCGGEIVRDVQSGRSSFHCPACQSRP